MSQIQRILSEDFNVANDDILRALNFQQKHGGKLEQILVNMGVLPNDQVIHLFSRLLNIPIVEFAEINLAKQEDVDNELRELLVSFNAFPISQDEKLLEIVCIDPLNPELNQWIANAGFERVAVKLISEDVLKRLVKEFVTDSNRSYSLDELTGEDERLLELASEAPTVNLLNTLITRALRQGASDMHLEPHKDQYRVRFRVDGVLLESEVLSSASRLPLVTRVKILSGMDISEKRRPQDGKIEMKIANEELDIRVSSLPLNDGESMVLRFLRKNSIRYDMSVIGLSNDVEEAIKSDIQKTSGVVLLTGPTGSGKTTTLYTFLNARNGDDVKIITLEDPVEYQLEGVNQVQVNSEIGFTFARGLRSIVRQDPDIIMLGEIRDKETAQIALQSALTGHLVFSTVHTNDAPSAYTRLLDLGVDEFLLNAALVSVVAQRLVRKVCDSCKVELEDKTSLVKQFDLESRMQDFGLHEIKLVQGAGCEKCGHTGYKGRMAITEYLGCDDFVKTTPKDANFLQNVRAHNHSIGRRNLLEDGLYKAMLGLTTIEEVMRVAG